MTTARLALRSLLHYRRTALAVVFGVAVAVAVLAGSLLVGSSVQASLRSIASSRLGAASIVVGSAQPFTESLGARLATAIGSPVAPVLAMPGVVTHESSSRRSNTVNVYGVDDRFFALNAVPPVAFDRSGAWISADLAREFGAATGDAIVVRLTRPTDIPIDSLHGRRDDVGRSVRATVAGVLVSERMGEFSLTPSQGQARSVFLPLDRLQRDLALGSRVNTLLVGTGADAARVRESLAAAMSTDDLALTIEALPDRAGALVESKSGLIPDAVADTLLSVSKDQQLNATPVLTWLATAMEIGERRVPYSLVTAIGPDGAGDRALLEALQSDETGPPPIVLNEWAARDLRAKSGDALELEYLRWTDEGRLITEFARFRVAAVMPMRGAAIDRRWAPDYPGITTARDITDWDPPFPIDLKRIRPQDESYWDQFRTAPKAFIRLVDGQPLWRSRHGQLTSIRLRPSANATAVDVDRLREAIARAVSPARAGFTVVDVRRQNLSASAGATDFGAYFSYFSAFLMVAALLLAALFLRLSVEQRSAQLGVLRASGFSLRDLRRLLLVECGVIVLVGAAAGVLLAIGWSALMMLALRTWWIGAVGTTLLELHVDPLSLALGAAGTALAAFGAVALALRSLGRATPRMLLTGSRDAATPHSRRLSRGIAPIALAGAVLLAALAGAGSLPAAAGFFGAGSLVLIGGIAMFSAWLGASHAHAAPHMTIHSTRTLALRNAAWRPGRSLTVAGLVASAVFLLVAVDSFRKTTPASSDRASGTGGFALIAESSMPIVHDLRSAEGRAAVGLSSGADLNGVTVMPFRLRPGDDASCLNLFQPKQPRILGVPAEFIREGRFTFARSLATGDEATRNPWTLLGDADAESIVPAIVDQTSLEYVLHAAVGDVITVDAESDRPLRLRIVASLSDSMLQGEILIAETAFRRAFPAVAGYRVFAVSVDAASTARVAAVTQALEGTLEPYGFDAEESASRLEAFHRVENTYLSTFQALGGLGLVLGCVGVVAIVLRNVLERRRELALLGAAGFTGRDLQRLVAIEHVAIVGAGLVIGLVAAAVAVSPVAWGRSGAVPWRAAIWVLPVAAAGLLAAFGATRSLRRLPLVQSLRSE